MLKITEAWIDTEPCLKHHDTDRKIHVTLTEPLKALLYFESYGAVWLTLKKGFQSDLATIPRPLWVIPGFSPLGRMEGPALFHDGIYTAETRKSLQVPDETTKELREPTREEADEILRVLGLAAGENRFVTRAYWLAVRAAAGSHFEESPEASQDDQASKTYKLNAKFNGPSIFGKDETPGVSQASVQSESNIQPPQAGQQA